MIDFIQSLHTKNKINNPIDVEITESIKNPDFPLQTTLSQICVIINRTTEPTNNNSHHELIWYNSNKVWEVDCCSNGSGPYLFLTSDHAQITLPTTALVMSPS